MQRRWLLALFVTVQFVLPAGLLAARSVVDRVVGYGWGWQMFS